ncbi:MAG TPA: aspartate aminotransferase family protein, partial [Streptosporangiaceae bacterium]
VAAPRSLAAIDAASGRMLADGGADPERPVYLSTLTVTAEAFGRRHAGVAADRDQARILRSVLMKPESETYLAELHSRVEHLAAG